MASSCKMLGRGVASAVCLTIAEVFHAAKVLAVETVMARLFLLTYHFFFSLSTKSLHENFCLIDYFVRIAMKRDCYICDHTLDHEERLASEISHPAEQLEVSVAASMRLA